MTQQPEWEYAGHIGDVDPIAHGGGFIYTDKTGVYPPELVWFDPESDEQWHKTEGKTKLTVYRLTLDPPRFKTYTERGTREAFRTRAKELPSSDRGKTWVWHNEWYVDKLDGVASSCGTTARQLLRSLFSKDPRQRAWVYESLIHHFGPENFDSYPLITTEDEAYEQYAAEMKRSLSG